jgi:CO/xanthine dehydrogenase Mo-binding subunit
MAQQTSTPGGPLNVVGKRGPNIDAVERVTGRAKYTGDIDLPGMLVSRVLRSPHAHARIVSIDTSKAEAVPGVRAVITYKDAPKVMIWGNRQYASTSGCATEATRSPRWRPWMPTLLRGR